jgi:DNA-binding NarL/FixJ family response regulator
VAGASGYLLKDAAPQELLAGVRAAADGRSFISPRVAAVLLERSRAEEGGPDSRLTAGERELLRLVGKGTPDDEIAAALGTDPGLLRHRVASVLVKLQAASRRRLTVRHPRSQDG